jgi:hypothetical protein
VETETPIDGSDDLLTGDEFRIPPEVQQKVLMRTLVIRVCFIAFFLALGFFLGNMKDGSGLPGMSLRVALITFAPMLVILVTFSLLSYLRMRNVLAHFRFFIGPDRVKRVQYRSADLEIPIGSIVSITENRLGDIRIQGSEPNDVIYIPHQVERKKELITRLDAIKKLEFSTANTFLSPADRLRAIASLIAFFTALYSEKAHTILLAGGIYLLLTAVQLYKFAKDKNAPSGLTYRLFLSLFAIAFVVYRMVVAYGHL